MRRGQIVREMKLRFNAVVDHSQVVDWTEEGVSPYGRVHRLDPVPSPELAYLCGVKLGDATLSKGTWQHSYKFRLLVIDRDFAEEFSRCASVVLNSRPFKVWWYERRGMWCTEVSSIMLYKFMKGGLERFKALVAHCQKCAAAFIRGFFDSEASAGSSGVSVSNGHLEVLEYVCSLLRTHFRIETSSPRPCGPPPGARKLIKGRFYRVNMQSYVVRTKSACLRTFADSVGFSIGRKSRELELLARAAI